VQDKQEETKETKDKSIKRVQGKQEETILK
jgi:hypothetical protein